MGKRDREGGEVRVRGEVSRMMALEQITKQKKYKRKNIEVFILKVYFPFVS